MPAFVKHNVMKKISTLFFLFCISMAVFGQNRVITGIVTDISGLSLPGTTVQIPGTTMGTTTDVNGKYSISVNGGSLRFSYTGFESQEIAVGNLSTIHVQLVESVVNLNQIVVIGYGAQKKKELTSFNIACQATVDVLGKLLFAA